jgi:toxin ParE1/3/4
MRLVYAQRARQDIADIYDYIARQNPDAAKRVEDMIRAACERLAEFPYASVPTDEPGVRRVPLVRVPYTIFCRIDEARDVVEIARVIHGARVRDLRRMPGD